MTSEADGVLARLVGDALDRLERGRAAFIPFRPTLTAATIVAAVERGAAERAVPVTTQELPTGIGVARRRS
jgi:hypothetical protein